MENRKLLWCCRLKDGLKASEPSETLAKSYLREAKASLERAEKNFADGDLLWATVVTYYAEYYALYAFLQRIGIKCENHFCSILAATTLLGENKTITINRHKDMRIDAQYYMRTGKDEEVGQMLLEGKLFVVAFDSMVSDLDEEEIKKHRSRFEQLAKWKRTP